MNENQILTAIAHLTKAILSMRGVDGSSVDTAADGPTFANVADAATQAIAGSLHVSSDNELCDELVAIDGSGVFLRPCLGMSPEEAKLCLEARITQRVRNAIGEAFDHEGGQ